MSSEIPSETVEVEASTDTDNPSVDSEATEISSTEESRTLGGVLTMDISAIGNEDVEFLKAQHAEIKKTIASFSDQMSELATADLSADERQKATAGIREQAREAIRNRILIDRKLAAYHTDVKTVPIQATNTQVPLPNTTKASEAVSKARLTRIVETVKIREELLRVISQRLAQEVDGDLAEDQLLVWLHSNDSEQLDPETKTLIENLQRTERDIQQLLGSLAIRQEVSSGKRKETSEASSTNADEAQLVKKLNDLLEKKKGSEQSGSSDLDDQIQIVQAELLR